MERLSCECIVPTGAGFLQSWLKRKTATVAAETFPTSANVPGYIYLQAACEDSRPRSDGSVRLTMDGIFDYQEAKYPTEVRGLITFDLLPLAEERTSLQTTCLYDGSVGGYWRDLLGIIDTYWPGTAWIRQPEGTAALSETNGTAVAPVPTPAQPTAMQHAPMQSDEAAPSKKRAGRVGRPKYGPEHFQNRDHFLKAVGAAVADLQEHGDRPTQELVGEWFGDHPTYLRAVLPDGGLDPRRLRDTAKYYGFTDWRAVLAAVGFDVGSP